MPPSGKPVQIVASSTVGPLYYTNTGLDAYQESDLRLATRKERKMTKEETLAECREKWAKLPTEEEAKDWWVDIGCEQCALCDYVESVFPCSGCDACPFFSGYNCHQAWEYINRMSYETWNYSIFKENFLLMQAAVNALTPDDLPDKEDDNE